MIYYFAGLLNRGLEAHFAQNIELGVGCETGINLIGNADYV